MITNEQIKRVVNEDYLDAKLFNNTDNGNVLIATDDDFSMDSDKDTTYKGLDFDVDDSMFEIVNSEDEDKVEETPKTPDQFGIASMLNSLIRDEWEAIEGYNSTIATLNDIKIEGSLTDINSIKKVLTDIVNEENIHVGQLQQALALVSPNAVSIDTGTREAEEQIVTKTTNNNADVLHPGMTVQTFAPVVTRNETNNVDDDVNLSVCTLTDIDDSF